MIKCMITMELKFIDDIKIGERFPVIRPVERARAKEGNKMSKFQKYMYLVAMSNGVELPREIVNEVIYGK